MDRRDLLKLGAAAGAAGLTTLGGSSCVLPRILFDNEPLPLPGMDDYLALIDQGVEYIESGSPLVDRPAILESDPGAERLVRKALKTLYLTAMFSDLPAEGQMHPGMQDRMWSAMPDMDEAVFGMTERVRSRTSAELKRLQASMQDPANPGMMVGEELDQHASACGLTMRRRLQTRAMFAHVDGRLRKQPPGLLVDEYVTKIDKLRERRGSTDEFERLLISQMGEEAFKEYQGRLTAAVQQWEAMGVGPLGPRSVWGGERPVEAGGKSGSDLMIGGGITMGVGALTLLVGGIVLGTIGMAGAFVMTAGGVILLIGLIVLIVGAATD